MIDYEDEWGGLSLLNRLRGSPFPSSILVALGSSIIGVLISALTDSEHYGNYFGDPGIPVQLFGLILAAMLIGRLFTAYKRYSVAESKMRHMSSKWSDVVLNAIVYDQSSELTPTARKGPVFQREFVHLLSLLHALAFMQLRGDHLIENLVKEKDVTHMRAPLRQIRGNLGFRSFLTFVAGIFQSKATRMENLNRSKPLAVINGVTENEAYFLRGCDDKVQCVLAWIARLIVNRVRAGGLNVPAPAVALLHQWLSDGQASFMELRGTVETPFPFPFAQLIEVLLAAFTILFPIAAAGYLHSPVLVWIFTLITVLAFRTTNKVAKVLEHPFTSHPNNLPLQQLQYEFNFRIAFLCKEFLLPSPGGSLRNSTENLPPAARTHVAGTDDKELPNVTGVKAFEAIAKKEPTPLQPSPPPLNAENRRLMTLQHHEAGHSPRKETNLVATAVEKLKEKGLNVQGTEVKTEASPRKAEGEGISSGVRQKAFLQPVREETRESLEAMKVNHVAAKDAPQATAHNLTRTSSNAAHLLNARSRSTGRLRSPPKESRQTKETRPIEPLNIVVDQKRQPTNPQRFTSGAGGATVSERRRLSTGADLKIDKESSTQSDAESPAKHQGIRPSFIAKAENLLESVASERSSSKPGPAKKLTANGQNPKAQEKLAYAAPVADDGENGDICLYDEDAVATPAPAKEYLPW